MPRRAEDKRDAERIAKRLAARVRAGRERQGMTQENLAEEIGLTAEAVGRIERGTALPSWPTFEKLCSALRMRPDELVLTQPGATGALRVAEPATKGYAQSPELAQLMRYARRLGERQLRLLATIARELAGRRK